MKEDAQSTDLAIIGMAGRFPGAHDVDEFWDNLIAGKESVSFFSEEEMRAAGTAEADLRNPHYVRARAVIRDADLFDPAFFGMSAREAQITDPQQRLFLEYAWIALEIAGYDPSRYEGAVGVFAGAGTSSYLINNLLTSPESRADALTLMIGNDRDFLTSRVSYKLGLRGPGVTLQSACGTSLVAVHYACLSLLNYECDMAITGGVRVNAPQVGGHLYQQNGIYSPDGRCRPFDEAADGTMCGDGLGVVVIKRLADALADGDNIEAIIKATAINNDGAHKVSFSAPSVDAQARVIAAAMTMAEVSAEDITYVEAHGTGTYLGDPVEAAALTRAFRATTDRRGFCGLGSVKSNIGHLDAAAGMASLIKTVQALKHKKLPPTLHFTKPNRNIDFAESPFYVVDKPTPWETDRLPRRAGVTGLGLGGNNVHVILEEAPPVSLVEDDTPWHLLVVSARTPAALDTLALDLGRHLESSPGLRLADAAYTCQVGRKQFDYRRAVVCADVADAAAVLADPGSRRALTGNEPCVERELLFVFSEGDGWKTNAGRALYETEPGFRESMDRCFQVLARAGFDDARSIRRDALACAVQYAFARLLIDRGLRPGALAGRGQAGRLVAACLADALLLEDALRVAALAPENREAALARCGLQEPAMPLLCVASGERIDTGDAGRLRSWLLPDRGEGAPMRIPKDLDGAVLLDIVPGATVRSANPDSSVTVVPTQESVFTGAADGACLKGVLHVFGQLWVLGVKIDWRALHSGKARRRIPLPTYPFAKKRYWIERAEPSEARSDAGRDRQRSPVQEWLQMVSWTRHARLDSRRSAPGTQSSEVWLVFSDGADPLVAAFAEQARAVGKTLVAVAAGETFRQDAADAFTVDPTREDDYARLLEHLSRAGRRPAKLVHFWMLTSQLARARHYDAQQGGFVALCSFARALSQRRFTDPVEILVVLDALLDVQGDDVEMPERATVLGALRVIPQELDNVACRSIDIGASSPAEQLAPRLVDYILRQDVEPIAAFRGQYSWIPQMAPLAPAPEASRLRRKGTYLVTGGLGGIGLTLAEYLVRAYEANVVLVGRSALQPAAEARAGKAWQSRIATLRSVAAQCLIVQADVTVKAEVEHAVALAREKFGPIHGVIHAAGVPGSGMLQFFDEAKTRKVLAPKVAGTLVLDDVFRDSDLDFMLLCSSIASLTGGIGQADYAAANAFLDVFASWAWRTRRYPVISVCWDMWKDVGMATQVALPDEVRLHHAALLQEGIAADEGTEIFERILKGPQLPHVVVSVRHLKSTMGMLKEEQVLRRRADATSGDTAPKRPREDAALPTPGGNGGSAPSTMGHIAQSVSKVYREAMGTLDLQPDDNVFELGADSIIAIRVAAQLRELLGVEVAIRDLFDAPTIAAMAELIRERMAAETAGLREATPDAGRGEAPFSLDRLEHMAEEEARGMLQRKI